MPRNSSQKAEALMKRWNLTYDHLLAIRFAINVAIATWIVWVTLRLLEDTNPIWAIASMVAASDPQPPEAKRMFRSRLINGAVGCLVGLIFIALGGTSEWMLPIALAICVLISSFIVRIKTMWRQAPITAAIVIAAGIMQESAVSGIIDGLHKVGEVIFGCVVGLMVSYTMSKVWLVKPPEENTDS